MGFRDIGFELVVRGTEVRDFRDLKLEDLPGSKREGEALEARASALGFKGATLRVGSEATEADLSRSSFPGSYSVSSAMR